MKLLLTDTFRAAHASRLEEFAPAVEVVELVAGTELSDAELAELDIAFFSPDCFPDRAAEFLVSVLKAPKMVWLQSFSAGVDHPIFASVMGNGTRLTTASGASGVPIAHAVVMHLLALSRQLPESFRHQMKHEWVGVDGRDLAGTTTVILGFGPIGRAVADLMPAFGSRVIAMRRAAVGDEPCEIWPLSRLHEALAIADQLVLALPSTPETNGILDAEAIAALPEGALVVNVGRGELIDEPALIEACESGHLGGVGLDVFVTEPLPEDSPLWDLPNVIVTPHISARTPATDVGAVEIFFENLARYIAEEPLANEV